MKRTHWAALAAAGVLVVGLAMMFLTRGAGDQAPSPAGPDRTAEAMRPATAAAHSGPGGDTAPPSPAPAGVADGPGPDLIVVFRRSNQPADRVLVRQLAGDDVRDNITDSAGAVWLADMPGAEIKLVDQVTSLTLAVLAEAPPRGTTLPVWEPYRLTGAVDFGATPAMRETAVRLGTGPRELPSARTRRITGSQIRIDPAEDAPWGMVLAPSPRDWRVVSMDRGGHYETEWMLAEHDPWLLATTVIGAAGVEQVSLAEVRPRETRRVDVKLPPVTALDVTMELPPGEVGAAIALGIRQAAVDPSWLAETNPVMSVLDVFNPDLAEFISGRENVYLTRESTTRLAPMPPFADFVIVARGATPAQTPIRQFPVPRGEITRLHYTAADLFPVVRSTATVRGRVLIEGTRAPADGVRITLSHVRNRLETETDDKGAFVFHDVPTEQELVFFIAAYDDREPPRFSRAMTEQFDAMPLDQELLEVEFLVPGFRWLIVEDPRGDFRPGAETTNILALQRRNDDTGEWEDFTNVLDFYFTEEGVEAEIRVPGTWRAKALVNGWTYRESSAVTFGDDDFEHYVTLADAGGAAPAPRTVRLLLPDGRPATDTTVWIAPHFPSAQHLELLTDHDGIIQTPPTNAEMFTIRVDTNELEFGGEVALPPFRTVELTLQPGV